MRTQATKMNTYRDIHKNTFIKHKFIYEKIYTTICTQERLKKHTKTEQRRSNGAWCRYQNPRRKTPRPYRAWPRQCPPHLCWWCQSPRRRPHLVSSPRAAFWGWSNSAGCQIRETKMSNLVWWVSNEIIRINKPHEHITLHNKQYIHSLA